MKLFSRSMSRFYSLLHWRKPASKCVYNSYQMGKFDNYDNYLILDFESTCDKKKLDKQEIIEFPCLWTDSNMNVLAAFHRYVKPIHNPILTPYCVELTGILQTMVEKEETFDKVLASFISWHQEMEKAVGKNQTKTFVTCGDWDLKIMLPDQCRQSGVPVPASMVQWLNLKKVFMETTNYYPKSLNDMCRHLGLTFVGREHSGIDDCHNILEILKILKMKNHVIKSQTM